MSIQACRSRRIVRRSVPLALALAIVAIPGGNTGAQEKPTTPLYLVGVGPGDPDLLTVRAIETVKKAAVVFCNEGIRERFGEALDLDHKQVHLGYWRLFPHYGTDLATLQGEERREAERLDAARKEFIAKVRAAVAEDKVVAILDNGDPMIYGPWEWTLEEFADLEPVVVPGLSSFNAANAALRKGVTNGEHTKAVILSSTDWPGKTDTIDELAAHRSTMVLFTMRAEFPDFVSKLLVNYPPETPVAIVKYAGHSDREEVVRGKLGTIVEELKDDDALPFEYLIYVGDFLDHRYHSHHHHSEAAAATR